jgi:hypothetical protein
MAFSKLEIALGAIIGLDIAAPGFSRAAAKAAVSAIGRSTMALAPRAAVATSRLAAANPVAAGTALGLGALQTQPGQQLLEMAEDRGRMDRIRFEQALTDLTRVTIPKAKARTKSKFNKAVSAGMKAVKASTSYGKKGTISNSKKAFSVVTKTASRINKGGKVAKSGITRKLGLLMRKIL